MNKRTTDRCYGACCRCFTLPFSPRELESAFFRWKNGSGPPITKNASAAQPIYQDIEIVAPMVVYLGEFKRTPKAGAHINPTDEELMNNGGFEKPRHYYRCKHFDPKAKVCTIYAMRPAVCRGYPYGHDCNYQGCTWKDVRAKKETPAEIRKRRKDLRTNKLELVDPGGEREKQKPKGKPKDKQK